MRGEQVLGRFTIDHERGSIIGGTQKEVVRTVGYDVEWWLFDAVNSLIDPIYDVGSSAGGRRWIGPTPITVVNASLIQGYTMQSAEGFYNTDVLDLTINMDVIEMGSRSGSDSPQIRELKYLPSNPDGYLRDRVVFRQQVFTPKQVLPKGIITNDYTLFSIQCVQVNSEEMVNDPQFQDYANWRAFGPRNQNDV